MTDTSITNILLVGVGGQGILLASEILSEACMLAGFDVKKNEVHGMSQRGGSVVSHVRYGDKVYSPVIPEGEVDILFGFELMETCRALPYLKPHGSIIANDLKIAPPSVLMGQAPYPSDILERLKSASTNFMLMDAQKIGYEAGNVRAANTAMLGAVSKKMSIGEEYWLQAMEKMVPPKVLDVNKKAFMLGRAV